MSFLKTFLRKKFKIAQVLIAITRELIGIFACSFLHHDPWNNTFKVVIEKQEYKVLNLRIHAMKSINADGLFYPILRNVSFQFKVCFYQYHLLSIFLHLMQRV